MVWARAPISATSASVSSRPISTMPREGPCPKPSSIGTTAASSTPSSVLIRPLAGSPLRRFSRQTKSSGSEFCGNRFSGLIAPEARSTDLARTIVPSRSTKAIADRRNCLSAASVRLSCSYCGLWSTMNCQVSFQLPQSAADTWSSFSAWCTPYSMRFMAVRASSTSISSKRGNSNAWPTPHSTKVSATNTEASNATTLARIFMIWAEYPANRPEYDARRGVENVT